MKKLIGLVLMLGAVILGGCSTHLIGQGGGGGSDSGTSFTTTLDNYNNEMAQMLDSITNDHDVSSAKEHYDNALELHTQLEASNSNQEEIMEYTYLLNADAASLIENSELVLDYASVDELDDAERDAVNVRDDINTIDQLAGFEY